MTETGFMVHYLLAHIPHPGLEQHPSDDSYFWSHFSEGTMMLHLQPALLLSMGAEGLAKKGGTTESQAEGINILYNWFNNGWVGKNLPLQLAEVEDFLSRHPNFSGTQSLGQGDVSSSCLPDTGADNTQFMMSYPINSLAYGNRKGMFEVGPHTMAWIHRIRARPGWKRAYERLRREDRLAKL
jgi:glutathione S-transferase